ncbi:unnamed protein product [Hydatigera taeniaeformis]|uniref:FERM domain-containing protein n=1 Tax=Hydatigena taeniaeformis TaxID=6205 RepID=A0A0R3WZT3_HYDTA|nr:unnamed protein product [Hydatigera taeniaeformis]
MTVEAIEKSGTVEKRVKTISVRVLHLDETVHDFNLLHHASGADLYVQVVRKFNILESDYFDLEFMNEDGVRCWLDHTRPLVRQIVHGKDLVFRFCVKFYTPHPNLLEEEYTRYLFALQIKRDLVTGVLICSENTAALLGSYIVQAEIGDFIKEEYRDINYLRNLKILHEPNDDRLRRVMDFHKNHVGMSPTDADFALLDTARKVEFYGVRLHPARDVIEFLFDTRNDCKRFWKKCIEHHAFFRCPLQERSWQRRPKVVTKGSSFRYIGRTQKELIRFMRESNVRRPPFERPSTARRAHPTMLTGPNYSHARMGTMSMTLRSKSADHRRHQLFDSSQLHLHGGIIGSSRNLLDQVVSGADSVNQLKRAHSSFVPNAGNIGLSTGAVATSGYSTMGGSSSGGHLAGEGLDADGKSLEDSNGERGGEAVDQELVGTMVPPSGLVRTDFDGHPSPVATVPPAVLASTASITNATTANAVPAAAPPPPPPQKPTRMGATSSNRRQNNEFVYGPHGGTLRRQASLAERRPEEMYGVKAKEDLVLHSKQMSTSTICTFGQQPQTSVQVLVNPSSGVLPSTTSTTAVTMNTVIASAQVRTPYAHDTTTSDVLCTTGSERNLQVYTSYREEELVQAEENVEETQLPPSMKLLGTTCQCKTTATQTAPVSDEEDEEVDCGKLGDVEVMNAMEVPVSSNPDRPGRKKLRQHSNQSSSGRIDSIFDGGTDSSATAAQIVGIDQWSSSGTESTTGVIIRSGVTAEWTNEQEAKPNPEPSVTQSQQDRVTSYPRRTEKSENLRGRQDLPISAEPFNYPELTPFGIVPRHPIHSSHLLPSHTCNVQSGFYGEGVAPCLYMHPLRLQAGIHCILAAPLILPFYSGKLGVCFDPPIGEADIKMCQRQHRDRIAGLHQQHHHHHHVGHRHHHHHRGHHKGEEHGAQGQAPPPPPPTPDVCCHGQPRNPYGAYNESSPSHKRSHRKRDLVPPRDTCAPQAYALTRRSKHRYKDVNGQSRPGSASKVFEGGVGGGIGGEEEPPALPSHGYHTHRHMIPMGASQPPTLPPKPGETKEDLHVCKLHSQPSATPATTIDSGRKRRQEESKPSRSDDRKQSTPVSGHHHHHHHRVLREQEEQVEAPHRLKRRPVQSPALVGEEPQSWGISSPILGEERSRMGVTRASPVLSTVASTAGKKIPVPKEYMEKIGAHKASIEALKRELRSVETASSVVTTASNATAKLNIASSRGGLSRGNAFSRGLIPEGSVQHPPPSISPSDEAAARLADTSGSASLGDLRNAILASSSGMGESSLQKKVPAKVGKDNEGLLTAPQDTTYLESESDSSPEQIGMHTMRRSLRESASRHSAIPPPGMSSFGEVPKPPSLPQSSSFSSSNSSDSSVVSYSHSQSLFSHGAAVSADSSVSQPSSSSDISSEDEPSFSSLSASPECFLRRRRPHHHHHACHECISRSQGHLQSYVSSSHRILSRHHQQNRGYRQDQKFEGKRSKSSHSYRGGRPDSMLLKRFFNDEIALETIARQQKLLKRELAKQKQLAAELEEAKRRTQRLLEEDVNMEKKIEEPTKREEGQEKEPSRNGGKRDFSPFASFSHRGHHRSSSSGRRHHRHHKSRRHRRQPSYSDEEKNSEEEHKKLSSEKLDEDSVDRASHQKRGHSRSRHHRHRKMSTNGRDESQTTTKEKGNKEASEVAKDQNSSFRVQKQVTEKGLGKVNEVEGLVHAEVERKGKNFDQSGEGLPPPPPPPQSPPPPQREDSSTLSPSRQTSSLSKFSDSRTSTAEKKVSEPAIGEAVSTSQDGSRQLCSITVTEEAGLARDIIKEVLRHTYARDDAKVSPEASSITHTPPTTSSITSSPQLNISNDLSATKSTKRTKILDSSFVSPVETSHHHELTSICLEPVPEGRVAETYSASRPYRPELTTFLGTNIKDQRQEKEEEVEEEEAEEEEEEEEVEDESDLDVEEIDSDSTSASEGSEDIEPFPLPPPDLIVMKESHHSPPVTRLRRGRELHEVIEEMEGGAVSETSILEHSAPLKPVTPVRLSQVTVAQHPELIEYAGSSRVGDTEVGGVEEEEEEGEDEEDTATAIASFVIVTPSKRSRNRRKTARQRQKSAHETKPTTENTSKT